MITKEKMMSLIKYKDGLEDKLKGEVPPKHKNHPNSYHEFLKQEIKMVSVKIEAAKLEGTK
jgi:hypothetical protein